MRRQGKAVLAGSHSQENTRAAPFIISSIVREYLNLSKDNFVKRIL